MKQSIICVVTLSLFFAACKKDSTTTVTKETPVTKYMQTVVSPYDSTVYEYNMDKSIYRYLDYHTSNHQFFGVIPTYEAGKLTKTVSSSDSLFSKTSNYQTISYNSLGQIYNIIYLYPDGLPTTSDSLLYNSDGKVDTILLYHYDPGTVKRTLVYKFAYTWDTKNNIIKEEVFDPSSQRFIATTKYTYDDKINPTIKVAGYNIIDFSPDGIGPSLSANNMLKSVTTQTSYADSTINTYVYDADNYPTLLTSISNQGGIKDTFTLKIIYGK